jgi:hypothetical protein
MYLIGLDLGQSQDYSALCVVEGSGGAFAEPPTWEQKRYAVRHLQRWALSTTYPAIVEDVRALYYRAPLAGQLVPLVVDATGVGRPVIDLFRASGLAAIGVTLTGGIQENMGDGVNVTVPKRTVVSTLVACFQTERLKIASSLEAAPLLINELANFKLKVSLETGNEAYEAWRESSHDDLVLSVGIALWYAERCYQPLVYAAAGEFRLAAGYRLEG